MLAAPEGDLRVMASSSETMRVLELFELQSQEGPCLDCYRTGQPVANHDLAADNAPLAAIRRRSTRRRLPFRARIPHATARHRHRRPQPVPHRAAARWSPPTSIAAQALADVATIAILQHRAALEAQVLNEQLQYALNSRIAIEQAKGMIAERDGVTWRKRSSTLRNHARKHNLRLAQVAEDLVSGALPASALDQT